MREYEEKLLCMSALQLELSEARQKLVEQDTLIRDMEHKNQTSKRNAQEILQKCQLFETVVHETVEDMLENEKEIELQNRIIQELQLQNSSKDQEIQRLYHQLRTSTSDPKQRCQETKFGPCKQIKESVQLHQDRQNHELNLRYKINYQQAGQETNVKPEVDEVIRFQKKNEQRNKVKDPEHQIQSQGNKEQQTETVKQNLNMTTATPNLHKAPHMQPSDEHRCNTTNRVTLVQSNTSEVTPPPPAIPLPTQQTR
jgi:hypothetical protein